MGSYQCIKVCLNLIFSIIMVKIGFIENGLMINLVLLKENLNKEEKRILNENYLQI